ncbi:protein JINGUBANG-like [Macadamia integrifolia]|uniref:protein JINGUBANG-like n=1 Tax=Macadamia integrifolia TaxID=60698 RepID=UPI001C4FB63B|nr:protein JINGUBANG-like [Macadamia integrifolia]
MGIVPCPLACHTDNDFESNANRRQQQQILHSELGSSLSSQPSLPSVPSLTPQPSQRNHHHHHHHPTPPAAYHCISTLKGHSSYVFSLALAGKFLYSGSLDREIRSWPRHPPLSNTPNPNLNSSSSNNNVVAVGNGAVKSLVFSGDKLFSAHQDHKIRVWHIDNINQDKNMYKLLATLPTLSDRVLRLLLPNNHVQVRRHKKCTWVHHVDTISALALSRDGSLLYSVSWDRTFKVWRTSDFKCLESVSNAHDDAINALALSNDGYLYTGSADTKIKVWGKGMGKGKGELRGDKKHSLVATLEKHKSTVNALALTTDGSVLYSGACDRSIVVWEKDSSAAAGGSGGGEHMVVVGALRGHTKAILCLAVVSDLVCSGSADKTVRIWKRSVEKSYSCLAVLEGHSGPVKCLTAAVDRNDSLITTSAYSTSYLVYSGSLDCDIRVWQILVPFP